MPIEHTSYSQLSPHEVATFRAVSGTPPEPPSHETPDQIRVIASANIVFVVGILAGGLSEQTIGVVDLPQKVMVNHQFLPVLHVQRSFVDAKSKVVLFLVYNCLERGIVFYWHGLADLFLQGPVQMRSLFGKDIGLGPLGDLEGQLLILLIFILILLLLLLLIFLFMLL